MKKGSLFILIILFLITSSVSAIKINEVEMNPKEGKDGTEWIELYNGGDSEKGISGWEIWEGISGSSGPKKILSITNGTVILEKGFYVIEWGSTKLNNDGDFVTLYDSSGNKIDETETLKEGSSSTKTWQLCDSWEFLEDTKGEKNNCETDEQTQSQENPPNDETNTEEEDEEQEEETTEITEEQSPQQSSQTSGTEISKKKEPITLEAIRLNPLNPKDIKSENEKNLENKSNLAVYGFMVFCILLVVLFMLRKRKTYHSEFD